MVTNAENPNPIADAMIVGIQKSKILNALFSKRPEK